MDDGLQRRVGVTRVLLALAGLVPIAWALTVLPVFLAQSEIATVARAIRAGESYKPEVLQAVEARAFADGTMRRASNLGKVAMIRLRLAENAFRTGDTGQIDQRLEALSEIMDRTLHSAPSDPFLWLARFWLENARSGLRPDNLRMLKLSYDLGPHEGWVAIRRNRYALAAFSVLPSDLADRAISEFSELVRWGLVSQAAEIAAGVGRPIRARLYDRLKDLSLDQRRPFARLVYQRGLDDVLVPGVDPPRRSRR